MSIPLHVGLMWLSVIAYGVLQTMMLVRTSGVTRAAATIPMAVMLPAAAMTAYAFREGSESAPSLLILLTPLACLYFLALTKLRGGRGMMPLKARKGLR